MRVQITWVLSFLLLTGCRQSDPDEQATATDAQVADTQVVEDGGAGDAAADASQLLGSPCPDDPVRDMAGLHMPNGRCYLMDANFTTMGDYWTAEQTHGPLHASSPLCEGIESGGFRSDGYGLDFTSCHLAEEGLLADDQTYLIQPSVDWPPAPGSVSWSGRMVCVNWCDAAAYCESQGKRLCGSTAVDTWAIDDYPENQVHPASADQDEHFNALTVGGTRPPLTGRSPLEGPFEGVWDLSLPQYMGPFPMISTGAVYPYPDDGSILWTGVDVMYGNSPHGEQPPRYLAVPSDDPEGGALIRCCADTPAR